MNIELYLSITSIVIIVITIVTGLEIRKTSKEINEMDIELKNMCNMENTIVSFYKKNNLKPETSLEEIAKVLKVTFGNDSRKGRVGCCRIYPCRGKRQTDPYKKFVENFTFL